MWSLNCDNKFKRFPTVCFARNLEYIFKEPSTEYDILLSVMMMSILDYWYRAWVSGASRKVPVQVKFGYDAWIR